MLDFQSLRQKLKDYWITLTGAPSLFSLRARIFHSVCVIVMVALLYNIPLNYLVGLADIAVESFAVLVMISLLYYNSRIRGKVRISIMIAQIVGNLLFAVNYFINSGIKGPTDLFFLIILVLMIAISPASQYKFWIPLNFVLVLALHAVEYYNPELVPYTYTTRFNRFIDVSSAYVVVGLLSYFCITTLRKHYDAERRSANDKSKAIEEQNIRIMKQNLELQRLNAEKNKLMSIIAHDLRSPLGSIQNSLEIITEYDLDSEDKQFIEKELLNTTKNTSAMLSRLLSWSKSQITGIAALPERHNLAQLLGNTLETEKSIAAQKHITLQSEIGSDIAILADGDMMELVVRNIISNAIKFTPHDGVITISTEVKEKECWISIRDSGLGMAPDKQKEIFSLNAQSTYGTDNEKGLGLGLLLCKEFITAQGGNIWFSSELGEGTTFYLSIPLFEEPAGVAQEVVISPKAPVVA